MIEQMRAMKREGKTYEEIGQKVGLSSDQVYRRLRKEKEKEDERQAHITEKVSPPLEPAVLRAQKGQKNHVKPSGDFVSVHYSDTHFPHESPESLSILYQIIHDTQPDLVVDHGDLLDCYTISRFEKDPRNRVTLQEEIEMAANHLAKIASIVPDAQKWFIAGNHEDRIRRVIWDMAADPKAKEILTMPGVMANLELPALLRFDDLGWKYHEGKIILRDKLILKHGTTVSKWSGQTARNEWTKYGKSGMSGHVHRRGVFEHRDWNGTHAWVELGCMCDLNPQYMEDPDWQNGFAVVTWTEDNCFGIEEVRIHDGVAVFRGRKYAA